MKKKTNDGIVYSTNPAHQYKDVLPHQAATISPAQQHLKVQLDTKKRAGKQVTLITGFSGRHEELELLAKSLKSKCGTGGSAKDGEIIIQGDFREKIVKILKDGGYGTISNQ